MKEFKKMVEWINKNKSGKASSKKKTPKGPTKTIKK